jgi:hypothetical protein
MHVRNDLLVGSAIALVLVSCSGPIISGHTQEVSAADIQAALTALQGSIVDGPVRPTEIEVIGHNEIRIRMNIEQPTPSNYIAMVRVKGSWQVASAVPHRPTYRDVGLTNR